MTTTAFDDQFVTGKATAQLRKPYDTVAILRRNIAALEVALKQQTERAEAAEAELEEVREDNHSMMLEIDGMRTELAKLAHQKHAATLILSRDGSDFEMFYDIEDLKFDGNKMRLYAAPVTTPHKGATHCDDCGLTWLDDGLNPLGCPYCKDSATEPAAPLQWREVMAELADDLSIELDMRYQSRSHYPSELRKYENEMQPVYRARAMLQSEPRP